MALTFHLEMASEEDKKKTGGWKADADGILIFVPRTSGHAMLRRLPHAEQPSRIDVAPLKTATTSSIAFAKGATGFVAILLPFSATLPSPEARAHGSAAPRSPSLRAGTLGSPGPSTSDLDMRALKSLYTLAAVPRIPTAAATVPPPRRPIRARAHAEIACGGRRGLGPRHVSRRGVRAARAGAHCGRPRVDEVPHTSRAGARSAQEERGARTEARNTALEMYQRQVRTLEEQLAGLDGLQEQVDQLAAVKLAVEERAAEQTETLRQLTEANGVLSARALQLAEDAAAVQEELRTVNAVSEREQTQRLALLEEINLVQKENGGLCQQLRAWEAIAIPVASGEGAWRHVLIPFLFFYSFGKPGTLPCRVLLVLLHHICLAT
ncbi:hypothetical protein EDB89DRAFT_2228010 [Lactarius sanguifluus]|nr:hypothetical protein EDB89DRAFT_2228010 [Lactarius sanguifluus]